MRQNEDQLGSIESVNIVIKDYIQFALTLFGFTLIGGIFERRSNGFKSKTVHHIFLISLAFLFSTMSFLLSIVFYSLMDKASWYELSYKILFGMGAFSFAIGIIFLMFILVLHYIKEYLID